MPKVNVEKISHTHNYIKLYFDLLFKFYRVREFTPKNLESTYYVLFRLFENYLMNEFVFVLYI